MMQTNLAAETPQAATARLSEFLTFTLGAEAYGVDILKVQEIRTYEAPTQIANSPDYILGVINLRGVIVPVVDMRIKFGLGAADYDQCTAVIVLNVAGRVVGMVVDRVSDVTALTAEQIRPAPVFSGGFDTRYITGIGTVDERMLVLMDIEQLIGSADVGLADNVH